MKLPVLHFSTWRLAKSLANKTSSSSKQISRAQKANPGAIVQIHLKRTKQKGKSIEIARDLELKLVRGGCP